MPRESAKLERLSSWSCDVVVEEKRLVTVDWSDKPYVAGSAAPNVDTPMVELTIIFSLLVARESYPYSSYRPADPKTLAIPKSGDNGCWCPVDNPNRFNVKTDTVNFFMPSGSNWAAIVWIPWSSPTMKNLRPYC